MRKFKKNIFSALLMAVLWLTALPAMNIYAKESSYAIPDYSGSPYTTINNNTPDFDLSSIETSESFEYYEDLDSLGRCSYALANLGRDLMPTQERGSIGSVKPTGWHTIKYDGIDGSYLYNRCHLIGYQLSGENANEKNLITGTRYLNVEGMLPFENMVADYIQETGNHVLYMVTPKFEGNELVARGVMMQALSIEDDGEGICFNVYCYNVQPGITIDYTTGDSYAQAPVQQASEAMVWIPNSGKKYHSSPGCSNMKNPKQVTVSQAQDMGFDPCKKCY